MGDILYDGWMILAALLPSIGLLFLFWVIFKHIVEADRRERAALREWEAEHAAQDAVDKPDSANGDNAGSEDNSTIS